MQVNTFSMGRCKSIAFSARWAVLLVMALLCHSISTHAAGKDHAGSGAPSDRVAGDLFDRVSGTVIDSTGRPIEGVTIMVKGRKKAVSTNAKGQFAIEANEGSVLVVSSAGYLEQQLKVTGETITISLKENGRMLEEVYVGYQRVRKTDVTGAMSSVKASEMNLSTPTIGQALVGKVAGVQVAQVSGAPYSGVKIRVRGTGSINASSEPLYVIDGYPVGGNIMSGPGNSTNGTGGYNPAQSGNDSVHQPRRHRVHRDPEGCRFRRDLRFKGFRRRSAYHHQEGKNRERLPYL